MRLYPVAVLDGVAPAVRRLRHPVGGVEEERLLKQPLAAVLAGHAAQSKPMLADRRAEAQDGLIIV